MVKSKKRPAKKKTQAPAIQKSSTQKNETHSTENKSSITQFLFGHTKINKKDLIEISIMIILIAFLIFMDLKMKEII